MGSPLQWNWQNGTSASDHLRAAAMGPDDSCVYAGFTSGNWSGTAATSDVDEYDWAAFKIDANGTLLWKYQNGTTEDDYMFAAAVGEDGSSVLAGQSESDFAVVKLDADGNTLWHFQDGTNRSDEATGVVISPDDNSVVVVGRTYGDWEGTSAGDMDFAAFKLDSAGTLIWRWQDGTNGNDSLNAVAMVDGGVVMCGQTDGDFGSANAGAGDFVAIKLDDARGGAEVWRWQNGSSADDAANALVALGPHEVVLAGYTKGDFGGDNLRNDTSDFVAVKLNGTNGDEVWRWQIRTSRADAVRAVTVQDDGTIVLAGTISDTISDYAGENVGVDGYRVTYLTDNGGSAGLRNIYEAITPDDQQMQATAASSNGAVIFAGTIDGLYTAQAKQNNFNLGSTDFLVISVDANPVTAVYNSNDDSDDGVDPAVTWVLSLIGFAILIGLWVFVVRRKQAANKINPGGHSSTPRPSASAGPT